MRVRVILITIFAFANSASIPHHENLSVSPSDIVYHFFSQQNPQYGVKIFSNNTDAIKYTSFSARKDTLFLIHGWKSSNDSDFNNDIREEIVKLNDVNVFVVDWSAYAGRNYVNAKSKVVKVGQCIADFINELIKKHYLELSQLKFVGWSLGAHISGNAGAALGGQVDRITGLDPAGPLFSKYNINERLDPTDAKFVQVIHTSNTLGFAKSCGHADYYVNGGYGQPGCGSDLLGGCSHGRVYSLYVESLKSQRFLATKCSSWRKYKLGWCKNREQSIMGQFVPDYNARGNYYLATNESPPYAMG